MPKVNAHFFGGPRDGWSRLLPEAETEIRVAVMRPRAQDVKPGIGPPSPGVSFAEAVYELQWASPRSNRAVYEYVGDKPALESAAWYVRPFEENKSRLEGRYIVARAMLEDSLLCDRDLATMIGEGIVAQMRRVLEEDPPA